MKSGEPFTSDGKQQSNVVIRTEGLGCPSNREYRDEPILLDVAHADPRAQVQLRRSSDDHVGQLPLPPRRAKVDMTIFRDRCPSMNGATNLPLYRWKGLGGSG